jgi:hypothetical protein
MTPERRQTLARAIALIRAASNAESFDAAAVRGALEEMGARFVDDGSTYLLRLAGVSACCNWNGGEHLFTRWAARARAALEESGDA